MAKFKEGNVVKVITPGYKAAIGFIGVVIDYITKDRLSVDFGRSAGVVAINECDLELVGETANKDVFIEKLHDSTFLKCVKTVDDIVEAISSKITLPSIDYENCLTDPNVDYEALSEEPVYYEFVDIGKALNKLKKYEHGL